jgi:hypothetical protein
MVFHLLQRFISTPVHLPVTGPSFWYDPRPGWDKMAFSRAIFALDHKYKLFSDGRLFAIDGVDYKEELLDPAQFTAEAKTAKAKLEKVIARMMQPPVSERSTKSRSTLTEIPISKK